MKRADGVLWHRARGPRKKSRNRRIWWRGEWCVPNFTRLVPCRAELLLLVAPKLLGMVAQAKGRGVVTFSPEPHR